MIIEFALLTKFFNDEGAPSNSPGWQKEKFVCFWVLILVTSKSAFLKKLFWFLVRLIIFLNLVRR
jgi:hypothetical protein